MSQTRGAAGPREWDVRPWPEDVRPMGLTSRDLLSLRPPALGVLLLLGVRTGASPEAQCSQWRGVSYHVTHHPHARGVLAAGGLGLAGLLTAGAASAATPGTTGPGTW